MMGLAILIGLLVVMSLAGYWAGQDNALDANTMRIYRDAELAGRDRWRRMKEDGIEARLRGRRIIQGKFAVPKGGDRESATEDAKIK